MSVVSQIEKTRFYIEIFVDGDPFLKLSKASFEAFPLLEGEEIDPEAYRAHLAIGQFPRAWDSALTTLEGRDTTVRQMRESLARKRYLPEVIDNVIARLLERGLLDDEKYARRYVERGSAQGVFAIRRKLRAKGVGEEETAAALEDVDDEQQRASALENAKKLARKYAGEDARDAKRKLSQALARRGFSWDAISYALARVIPDDE